MDMNKHFLIALFFTSMLTACSLAPDFTLPEISTPETLKNTQAPADIARVPEAEWWKQFGSEELSGLIDKTTTENNDLLAAAARIEQAQALAKIAGAPLLPSLSANGNAGRNFNSNPSVAGHAAQNSYSVGAQISYEVDIFGKLRDAANAADESAISSAYDRDALRLATTAQTAEAYFNLLALDERVVIAANNLNNARDILAVTQTRFDAGVLSELELSQQKNLTENEEATLATLKQQREVAQNLLAILVGELPEKFTTKDNTPETLKPPMVAAVLPAELITHRPDIASLEAQLRAANFNIGAARAAFFPSINLTGSTALGANPASAPASVLSALAASISVPLFTGGELEGGLENATAKQKELAADYRKAVLTAFGEAENALYGVQTMQDRLTSLSQATDDAKKAYDASLTRFNAGATDYLTLLTTQNSLLQAQDSLAQAQADRLSASVELFKALGGGWSQSL